LNNASIGSVIPSAVGSDAPAFCQGNFQIEVGSEINIYMRPDCGVAFVEINAAIGMIGRGIIECFCNVTQPCAGFECHIKVLIA